MKALILAAIWLAGATLTARASPGGQQLACVAKVLHSEELPFAPPNQWGMSVTLEITPPGGGPYRIALHDKLPWQAPPPRQGQSFRVWCDPANPGDLHLIR